MAAKRGMFRWLEDSIQRRRFSGLRAAPDGGWGGAEICFILSYMLTACRQIFFYVVPGILDAVVFLIAMLVPKLDNTANIL